MPNIWSGGHLSPSLILHLGSGSSRLYRWCFYVDKNRAQAFKPTARSLRFFSLNKSCQWFQVLCGQPEPGDLFGFCADYLEGRLEQRDSGDLTKKKRVSTKKEKEETEKTTRRMLRREGTFNLYATDSGEPFFLSQE